MSLSQCRSERKLLRFDKEWFLTTKYLSPTDVARITLPGKGWMSSSGLAGYEEPARCSSVKWRDVRC